MNNSKHATIITLYSILVKGKKHYCTPYPVTLLSLLEKIHNINIGRRWLFQCLHDIEEAGYITRQRRWENIQGPEIRSLSSIFALTVRGLQYLIKKGVGGAKGLLRQTLDWLHKKDRRQPTAKDLLQYDKRVDDEKMISLIRELIKKIG